MTDPDTSPTTDSGRLPDAHNSLLKSCPLCGGEAQKFWCFKTGNHIECKKCRASTGGHPTFEMAASAWNQRAENEQISATAEKKAMIAEPDICQKCRRYPCECNPLFAAARCYAADFRPVRCKWCGCCRLKEVDKESIEGTTCEFEVRCRECGRTVGYWAYGSFDPCYAEPHNNQARAPAGLPAANG